MGEPVEGGLYCSSGIWRPTENSRMRHPSSEFDPVGREQLVLKMTEEIKPVISRIPDVPLILSPTPSTISMSAALDERILPQGVNPIFQWYMAYINDGQVGEEQPIPGATAATFDFNLAFTLPKNNVFRIWLEIYDPDINDYVRRPNIKTPRLDGVVLMSKEQWEIASSIPSPIITDFFRNNDLSFTNKTGEAGTKIKVLGKYFCWSQCNISDPVTETTVTVAGITITPDMIDTNGLIFTIPDDAAIGPEPITINGPGGIKRSIDNLTVIQAPPIITSISKTSGKPGDYITVYGSNLCVNECNTSISTEIIILIGGKLTNPGWINQNSLWFLIPEDAEGIGPISIFTDGKGPANSEEFTIISPPIIASISKTTGKEGDLVEILGSNFCFDECNTSISSETKVIIGGVLVTPDWVTENYLRFDVPSDATGTGPIQVFTSSSERLVLSTEEFTVISPPIISSIFPSSGPSGTVVTVDGDNLCFEQCNAQSSTETYIIVGGVVVRTTTVNTTSLTFVVPDDATGIGPIEVITTSSGKSNTSDQEFIVTP